VTQDPHDRLGAAVRGLNDAIVRTGADAEELTVAAARIEAVAADLAARPPAQRVHDSPYHPMSLVWHGVQLRRPRRSASRSPCERASTGSRAGGCM